jgi:hypothetical protein
MKLVVIIIIVIIAGIVIGVVSSIVWVKAQIKHNLDKGCRPEAWNQWLVPTRWACPDGVTVD